MSKTFMDIDTGELIEIESYSTKKQKDGFSKYKKMTEQNKEFVKEYGNFLFKVKGKQVDKTEDKITNSDIAKLIYVATYLDYDNNLKLDSGKYMDKSDLKEVVNVNKNIFYKWFNNMEKYKLITILENGNIQLNTKYCLKGELSKNKDYSRVFINAIRHIYECNSNKDVSSLGIIFKILPYASKENNMLCYNPNCLIEEDIKLITVGDIAKETEEYKDNAKKLLMAITKYRMDNGEPILIFLNDLVEYSNATIMINPRLTYSGYNFKLKNVYELFKMYGRKYNQQILIKTKSKIKG